MGEATRKQNAMKRDFLEYLNANKEAYRLIYPYGENEGILSHNIPFFSQLHSNWCKEKQSYPIVKLRLIDTWIADYNRVLPSGDIWTIKSTLINCDLKQSPQFRLNMIREFKKLAKAEGKEIEKQQMKGDTVFYSLSCFLSNKILKDKRISEVILSPALFDLFDKTFEPDQVVLDNNGQTFFTRELAESVTNNNKETNRFLQEIITESAFSWDDLKVG